jgi:hypothetical protein
MLQAVAVDAKDLETVVRRVRREEQLAARRQRERAAWPLSNSVKLPK